MADINHNLTFEKVVGAVDVIDEQLRDNLGNAIAGISLRGNNLTVHFLTAPGPQDNLAAQIVNAHNTLVVTVDQSVIAADGLETATITCVDPVILGDSDVDYTVWLDGDLYTALTSTPVSGGQVQLTLTTEDAGIYVVEIKRQGAGDYETGYITIQAQEVS